MADPFLFACFPFPRGQFRVHALRGEEHLSRGYVFHVETTSPAFVHEHVERLCLGQRAVLAMASRGRSRLVGGVVDRVTVGRKVSDRGLASACFRLVPSLALLRYRRGSRIFQDRSLRDIVEEVTRSLGVKLEWSLTRSLPVRPYVTQYEETDLAFVRRILAEAGVYHWIDTPEPSEPFFDDPGVPAQSLEEVARTAGSHGPFPAEVVHLSDATTGCRPIAAATLGFLAGEGLAAADGDRVTRFDAAARVTPNVAEYREFDPARPHAPLVSEGALHDDVDAGPVARFLTQRHLETYEHHGPFLFPEWSDVVGLASQIARQRGRKRLTARGEGLTVELAPGRTFQLEGHPIDGLNRGWMVTRVRHEGVVRADERQYRSDFSCVPEDVLYAPTPPRRRNVQVLLTATVVGAPDEEVHTDPAGRIKILFHWDRRGVADEGTSCWVRAIQPWAGAAFGHQFIPRVGMEVAVSFEGGDPDKPIVLGSLFNATHVPPFPLPLHKLKSGIRTSSSPRSAEGGFNELSFDDTASRERVFVHAQRNLDVEVRGDHQVTVHGSEAVTITGGRRGRISGDDVIEVAGEKREVALGLVTTEHRKGRVEVVHGPIDAHVEGTRTTVITQSDQRVIGGETQARHVGDVVVRALGNHTLIVGQDAAPRGLTLSAMGTASMSGTANVEISSPGSVILRSGKSFIRIADDGIEVCGSLVRIVGEKARLEAGDDGLKIDTENVYLHAATDTVILQTEQTSLAMTQSEVKLDGKRILLNSPEKAQEEEPPEREPPTEIELVDGDGNPLSRQRFVIELPDGTQRSGLTDDKGCAMVELTEDAKIRFPELPSAESA
ncbi:MAG: type VI secretion system tip protein VgrG [Polyangiaceae bacterium]|nr:type VI secretion system tip protein VgrG [Polyangiaceae bacterium]